MSRMNYMTPEYEETYIKNMEKILSLRPQVEKIVDQVMTPEKKNLFLVGIGGTLAIMLPFMKMFKKPLLYYLG